jgi:hypothetical protein
MNRSDSVARFERHLTIWAAAILFALGVWCLVTLPATMKEAMLDYGKKLEGPKSLHAIELLNPDEAGGASVGWLLINYKDRMSPDEDAVLEVIYKAQGRSWGHQTSRDIGMSVVVASSSNLSISPPPNNYIFDGRRLAFTGVDNHIWTVSAKNKGNYLISFRYTVPRNLKMRAVAVNGNFQDASVTEFALPVEVSTPFISWTLLGTCAQCMGTIISFLLGLPLASVIVAWYLKKKIKEPKEAAQVARTDQATT